MTVIARDVVVIWGVVHLPMGGHTSLTDYSDHESGMPRNWYLLRTLLATGCVDEAEAVLDAHRGFFATHPGLATAESMTLAAAAVASEADPNTAATMAAAALASAKAIDQAWYAGEAADLLAVARLRDGDADGAREAARRRPVRPADRAPGLAVRAAFTAAVAERARGDDPGPVHDALAETARLGLRPLVVDGLEIVAAVAADEGRGTVAARLQGAADRLRAEMDAVVSPICAASSVAGVTNRAELAAAAARRGL